MEQKFVIQEKRNEKSPPVDAEAISRDLRNELKGEVRFDDGSRALYATDGSNYRQIPIGVVVPLNEEDIVKTINICNRHGAPVLSRGGGTSLAGQCCNVAVVMDMSKYYNNFLHIDTERKLATVHPGIILDDLNKIAKKDGLVFGPDPATHNHCTIGGMIGNNSCGIHSVMASKYGNGARTSDNLEEMEIITHDGTQMTVGPTSEEELEKIIQAGGKKGKIYKQLRDLRDEYADEIRKRYPKIPRRVSGYNLDDLLPENGFNVAKALAGSESTLITILKATVKLIPNPPARSLLVLGYPDVFSAGHHIPELLGYGPIGLEGMDHLLYDFMVNRHMHVENLKMLPDGKAWLLVEFEGKSKEDANETVKKVMQSLQNKKDPPSMALFNEEKEEEKIWKIRESGLGATAFVPGMPDSWPGWEDAAVEPNKVGDYMKDFRSLLEKYNYIASLYGHFGQGLVHCRISFDLFTKAGLLKYRRFLEEASDLVLKYNGSFSGEHGDGQARAELLVKMYGEKIMTAHRKFKSIWDPKNLMNPGKVVDPYPILSNLRLGKDYEPSEPNTYFKFPEDKGSFSRAVLRCVGVGKCRREGGGTMCPSYMVTREEKHTTRGRAHSLFEMLQGDVIKNGWKDEHVKESLDLCLACKGCKGDCPVSVDMATYKAEFFSHYYKGKIRPLHAHAFGKISVWSRIGTKIPGITNTLLNSSFPGNLLKKIAGIEPKRSIPEYAQENFKTWFKNREIVNAGKPEVILWPDTFNNYFHPWIAIAAVEAIEHLGFRVKVPTVHLCCGRPLYDYGMLDLAKKWLRQILNALKEDIRNEVPIIGLEPSCISVFRDELTNLFPNDEDAMRLRKNAFLLSEFLEKKVKNYSFPKLNKKAIVHGHCHHKSILKMTDEEQVLKKLGLDFTVLDSGCCGMAGAFGFEKDKYEVSVECGERVLMPAVREADKETLLILNGFSCKEQVLQQAGKKTLHLAEVLKMAIDGK